MKGVAPSHRPVQLYRANADRLIDKVNAALATANACSTAEIAVSIAAGMIAVRTGTIR